MKLSKNIISLIIALVLGVVTVVLVNVYLSKEKKRIGAEKDQQLGKEITVMVAATDIARGSKINQSMIQATAVRESALQPRVATSAAAVVGKVAIADILSGEQITTTKLMSGSSGSLFGESSKEKSAVYDSGASLAMKIPAGKRSYTISIDEVSAAGGMIRPNDYVDIVGIFPFTQQVEDSRITQNVSVTLLQNILVLAVGRQLTPAEVASGEKAASSNTITIALTPQQVELMSFASDFGKLRLILRPPLETQIQAVQPVTSDILWQQILTQAGMQVPAKDEGKPAVAEGKKTSATVEVFRGKQKEIMPLD